MEHTVHMHPEQALERLRDAIGSHDIEQVIACFSPEFRGEHPAHPERNISGHDQIRTNWGGIFGAIPDIRASILNMATVDSVVLVEWRWSGRQLDGTPFSVGGVTVQEVSRGLIAWTRLYMEPIPTA